MQVAVIGLGYVGLVTASCMAEWGIDVIGADTSQQRLDTLRASRLPFFEPGLDDLVQNGLRSGRLRFTPDPAAAASAADVVIVAVGTHDGNGGWQTKTIQLALESIVPALREEAVLVIRSTMPPHFINGLPGLVTELRRRSGQGSVPVLLNPEFTREGSAVEDFMRPNRIVVGVAHDPTGWGVRQLRAAYCQVTVPILVMGAMDAALSKLGSNVFLATKISFANELASICDAFGARIDEVIGAMALDPRIGSSFLGAGVGFGGSCLPHQVSMTVRDAESAGISSPLLAAVNDINHRQRSRFVDLLERLLDGSLRGRRVGMLGLAFKPHTDDLRDAPSLSIAEELMNRGAIVVAYDPQPAARERAARDISGLMVVDSAELAIAGADALALVTEWPEFSEIDWEAASHLVHQPVIVDGRNALSPERLTAAGFTYTAFGRGEWRAEATMSGVEPFEAAEERLREASGVLVPVASIQLGSDSSLPESVLPEP